MNQDDLKEYKEKLSNLSEEEKKKREDYLRRIGPRPRFDKMSAEEIEEFNKMMSESVPNQEFIYGPTTGYVSIDRPELAMQRIEPYKKYNFETVYNMIFNGNRDLSTPMITFMGKTLNGFELREMTDNIADNLYERGIGDGDTVLLAVANCVESIATILALNKIGARAKLVDVRAGYKEIGEYANGSNCKAMISFNMIIDEVKKVIDDTKLQFVVGVNPCEDMPFIKKGIAKILKPEHFKKENDARFISMEEMKRKNNHVKSPTVSLYDKGEPRKSFIVQSSGTTGTPKSIVHTDLSFANCAQSSAYLDLPLKEKNKILVALPPWIAYGIFNAMFNSMLIGCEVVLSEDFEPDAVMRYIGSFDSAYCAPFHCRHILKNYSSLSNKQKQALKKSESFIVGGDKLTIEECKEFENTFGNKVLNGYGFNEGLGVITVNSLSHNKPGSAGIPKYRESLYAVDEETREELPIGSVGRLYSKSSTMFSEYENNPEKTKKILIDTPDGKVIDTNDIGYVDELGVVRITGRTTRVITRLGFKISASTIEDNICSNDFVNECITVGVKDPVEEEIPFTFVVPKDSSIIGTENEEIAKQVIMKKCEYELKKYELPKYVVFVDKLPYTNNNKYDIITITDMAYSYIENMNKENRGKRI